MPEYVLTHDLDTGWISPVTKEALPHGNYEILDESPSHPVTGDLVAGRFADATLATEYDGHTVTELKAEIAARNEGRDESDLIPTDGLKADHVAALVADDKKGDF